MTTFPSQVVYKKNTVKSKIKINLICLLIRVKMFGQRFFFCWICKSVLFEIITPFKLRHALTSRWRSRNETRVSRDKSKREKLRVSIHKNIEKPAKSLSVARGVQTQFVRCTLFRLFIKFDLTLHPSSWIYHTALFSTIFLLFICKYKTGVYTYSNFFYFEIGYYPPRLLNE